MSQYKTNRALAAAGARNFCCRLTFPFGLSEFGTGTVGIEARPVVAALNNLGEGIV